MVNMIGNQIKIIEDKIEVVMKSIRIIIEDRNIIKIIDRIDLTKDMIRKDDQIKIDINKTIKKEM